MKCETARELLPLVPYEELSTADVESVRRHTAGCGACSLFERQLESVRSGLDAISAPAAKTPSSSLFAEALLRERASLRRWRFATIAASLMAVVAITMIWIDRSEKPEDIPGNITAPVATDSRVLEELQQTRKLLTWMSNEHDRQRREFDREIKSIAQAVALWKQESDRNWNQTRRDVSALYTAQFGAD